MFWNVVYWNNFWINSNAWPTISCKINQTIAQYLNLLLFSRHPSPSRLGFFSTLVDFLWIDIKRAFNRRLQSLVNTILWTIANQSTPFLGGVLVFPIDFGMSRCFICPSQTLQTFSDQRPFLFCSNIKYFALLLLTICQRLLQIISWFYKWIKSIRKNRLTFKNLKFGFQLTNLGKS